MPAPRPPSAPKTELAQAIEGLYETFSGYPLRRDLPGCPCCICGGAQRALFLEPARTLWPTALQHFAERAVTVWGSVADFKHFLPRLFELVAARAPELEAELVLGKLRHAAWHAWPEPERLAVARYLVVLWRDALAAFPGPWPAADLLVAIAAAEDDLRPFLAGWDLPAASGLAPALGTGASGVAPTLGVAPKVSVAPVLGEESMLGMAPALAEAPTLGVPSALGGAAPADPWPAAQHLAALINEAWPAAAGYGVEGRRWPPPVLAWIASEAPRRTLAAAAASHGEPPGSAAVLEALDALAIVGAR